MESIAQSNSDQFQLTEVTKEQKEQELASLNPKLLETLINEKLFKHDQLSKLAVGENQTHFNNLIAQNKEDLSQLYGALTKSFVNECNQENHLRSFEAFLKLAPLALTGCALGQQSTSIDVSIPANYSTHQFTSLFEVDQLSASQKESYSQINFELAQSHHQQAMELKNDKTCISSSDSFKVGSYQYHQALAIAHHEMASKLGDASSSFELAKIYGEPKSFVLPMQYKDGMPCKEGYQRSNQTIAVNYAYTAVTQGDDHALSNFAKLHKNEQGHTTLIDCRNKAFTEKLPEELNRIAEIFKKIMPLHAYGNSTT